MLHRQLSSFSTTSSSSTLMRKCLQRSTTSSNSSLTPFLTSSVLSQQTREMSSCSSRNNNNYGDDIKAIRQSLEKLVDDHKSLHNAVKDLENKCVTKFDLKILTYNAFLLLWIIVFYAWLGWSMLKTRIDRIDRRLKH